MNRDLSPNYKKILGSYPLLTPDEEKELFDEYKSTGDKNIKDRIVNSNLRLVFDIAVKYSYVCDGVFSIDDLVSYGILGLIKAIDKFDSSKNTKFSTYAYYWIRRTITYSLDEKHVDLRSTHKFYREMLLYYEKKYEYYGKYGEMPSFEELSKITELTVSNIKFIEANLKPMISLDGPINEGDDISLMDSIDSSENVDEIIDYRELKSIVLDIVKTLDISDEQKDMFILRYGILDGRPKNLDYMSKKYGVSHQAVSQVMRKILGKIRNNSTYLNMFDSYVNPQYIKKIT